MTKSTSNNEVFVNLKSDFGFKRIFARPENKELLKSFLNALFQGEIEVNDIVYDSVERTPNTEDEHGLRYDVYCHMPSKDKPDQPARHFIIEMQNQSQRFFDKRAIYYMSSAIVSQVPPGDDYNFVPVIGIFVMDFDRQESDRNNRMIERKWIADRDTHEPFHDLMRMYFIKLPLMQKTPEECKTESDMWIYCIKNLEHMQTVPFTKSNPIFSHLASEASVANLSRAEYIEYERSQKAYRDYRNALRYQNLLGEEKGHKKGLEEGMKEGMKKGEEIGMKKANLRNAKMMKDRDMSFETIAAITGLTLEEIQSL